MYLIPKTITKHNKKTAQQIKITYRKKYKNFMSKRYEISCQQKYIYSKLIRLHFPKALSKGKVNKCDLFIVQTKPSSRLTLTLLEANIQNETFSAQCARIM